MALTASAVLVPDIALAARCDQPVLAPGQEARIERLVTPTPLPAGVSPGDTRILADRLVTEWKVDGVVWRWVLSPVTPTTPPQALRTARLALQRAFPCPEHGEVPAAGQAPLPTGAQADAGGATPDGACPVPPQRRKAIDEALLAAVRAGEADLVWTCPQPATDDAGIGRALRQMDARLAVADPQGAARELDALLARLDRSRLPLSAHLDLGLALQRLGRQEAARAELQAAVQAAEKNTDVHVRERLAAAKALLGDALGGVVELERCWQEVAGEASCQALPLASALERLGKRKEAADLLDRQLQRSDKPRPEWFAARIGLASRMDDAKAEMKTAEAAVRAWPEDLALQDALATACFRSGQHQRAIRVFEGVLKKDPRHPHVLGRLSGVFNDMGRVEDEAAKAGKLVQPSEWARLKAELKDRAARDPQDTVAQFLHGVALFYDGRFEDALAQMRRVEPLAPQEGRVYVYQAMAHLWLGRRDEAERVVAKAIAANPMDPDVYYCESQIVRTVDLPRAIRGLERYVALASAPGALQFEHKTHRVEEELALLRKGVLPPLWDRPGHYADHEAGPPPPRWPWLAPGGAALGLLGLLGVAGLAALVVRRRRRT